MESGDVTAGAESPDGNQRNQINPHTQHEEINVE